VTEAVASVRIAAILACAVAALFFTFVSMTGVIRLPDVYARSHTASQADTLGAGFGLAAVALTIGLEAPAVKTVLLLAFIFVTNPTAAHAVARAAFEEGIEPWTETDRASDADLAAGRSADGTDRPVPGDGEPTADGGAAAADDDPAARDGPTDGGESR